MVVLVLGLSFEPHQSLWFVGTIQLCRVYWSLYTAQRIFGRSERLSKLLQLSTMIVNGALAAVRMTHEVLSEPRPDIQFEEIMEQTRCAKDQFQPDPLTVPRKQRPPK